MTASRPTDLAIELRLTTAQLVRRLRSERSSEAISDGQYGVLAALTWKGPMTPTALAEDQHVQVPPMVRTINAVVRAGLARRDPHPTDRRQVLVSITEAGRDEVAETRRRRTEWLAKSLTHFTPDEREVLAQATVLLQRLVKQ